MTIPYVYATGTISVNAAGTAVTGVGTAWQTVGITRGDKFIAAGLMGIIESVTDNTHLTLSKGWPGASNLSGVSYEIVEDSPERDDLTTAQRQLTQIVNIINGTGYIYEVAAGGTPDPSLGEDGQYAFDFENGKWWKKIAGVWDGPHYHNVAGDADYLVKTAQAGLSAERVVTDNSAAGGAVWDWSVAGQVKAKLYASAADKLLYSTAVNVFAEAALTAQGRALIAGVDAAAQRGTLGLPNSGTTAGRLARFTDAVGSQGQTSGLYEDGSGNVAIGATSVTSPFKLEIVNGQQWVRLAGGTVTAHFKQLAGNGGIVLTDGAVSNAKDFTFAWDPATFGFVRLDAIHQGVAYKPICIPSSTVHFGGSTGAYRVTITGASQPYNGTPIAVITTGTGATTDENLQFGILDANYAWIQATKPGTGTRNLLLQPQGGNVGFGALTAPANTIDIAGSFGRGSPVTKTADFAVAITENNLICNKAGTTTVTMPSAATYPGREVLLSTIQAQTVVSAGSNVVPLAGGAAGTAILAATAGKWAKLVSNATNWQIMAAN